MLRHVNNNVDALMLVPCKYDRKSKTQLHSGHTRSHATLRLCHWTLTGAHAGALPIDRTHRDFRRTHGRHQLAHVPPVFLVHGTLLCTLQTDRVAVLRPRTGVHLRSRRFSKSRRLFEAAIIVESLTLMYVATERRGA